MLPDRCPIPTALQLEIYFVQPMLTIFASRAAAELNRRQADDALRSHF